MAVSTSDHWSNNIKPVEIVYDEERIKILIDDTRKRILNVLSNEENDLSVTEIAEKLGTNPQRIYHHVDKLVEYKFLMKTREERKKRSITTFYARTATAFVVSYSTDRGFIHDQALIEHFIDTFRNILGIDLNIEEEIKFGSNLKELAEISESVFTQYSNLEDGDEIQRHSIENLYFLLEYMIFMTNPNARKLINQIKEMIEPKLPSDSIKKEKY